MTFILSLALYVVAGLLIAVLITRLTQGDEAADNLNSYFNLDKDQSKALKYVIYAAWVYIAVYVLSVFILPLATLLTVIWAIEAVLAWWWVVEAVQSGKAAVWLADFKAKFEQK